MTKMLTKIGVLLMGLTSVHFFCVGAAYGQLSQDDTIILLQAFKAITSQREIVYVDTVNSSVPARLSEIFHKGRITDKRLGNTIVLTKKEGRALLF